MSDRGRKVASPPETPQIAVSLARAGWPVFPVTIYEDDAGKRHKVPAVKWKEWATTDVKAVGKAFAGEHSGRWIGVYAGAAGEHGIVVLDVDPGGDDSLADAGLAVPKTFNYPTHRAGGRHFVYAAPEGVELTIAKGLLTGVDVRSGAGLMIYYGPELTKAPKLAPAPAWLLVRKGEHTAGSGSAEDRAPSADEDAYRARLVGGKPDKAVREILATVKSKGMGHDDMLEAVTSLVKLGTHGHRGVAAALDAARETYAAGWPDAGRHWDNAVTGSVRRLGLPPMTFELSKAERKAIVKRNSPEAIEEQRIERKASYIVARIESGEDLSDDALSEHVSDEMGDTWANTAGLGLIRYDGVVWAPRDRAVLINDVRVLLREIRAQVTALAIRRGDTKLEADARTLGARSKITAVADLAAGLMLAREVRLDHSPDLLNVRNGVVDLRTGEIRERVPGDFFTKCCPTEYHPDADLTEWHRALQMLPPKVAAWLQVRLGQAITGHRPDDDVLVILEGSGQNGKTTLLEAVRQAIGEATDGGYAATVSDQLLLADPNAHPTTLMSLMGVRLAVFEELPEGRNLNVKRLKDVVGTPKITARRMRQDEVTFPATHALFGSTNYLPVVAETDHGTWRRLALCVFPYRFVESKKLLRNPGDRLGDPRIRERFERPDPAVLAWLVAGARAWYDAGRKMNDAAPKPKRVRQDTQSWRLDADPVMGYIAERIERSDGHAVATIDLASDFNGWIERRGHRPWSQTTINARFGGHEAFDGIDRKRVAFGRVKASRPSMTFGMKPLAANTQAWLGVRFADEETYLPSEAQRDAATFADLAARIGS